MHTQINVCIYQTACLYIHTLISDVHLISLSLTHLPSKINVSFIASPKVLDEKKRSVLNTG